MTDPVKLVSDATGSFFDAKDAARILTALTDDGWRLVRGIKEDELDDDPDSPTYGEWVSVLTITEEWTGGDDA